MANLFQVEGCQEKPGPLVAVLKGVTSSHAPKEHGRLLKDIRMRIDIPKGLKGRTNDLLNEPCLADCAKSPTARVFR
jgi:hypothetical protein